MKVTREQHLSYMTRMVPLLVLVYVFQSWLIWKYIPAPLSTEAILFTGLGLIGVIASFMLYDHYHEITLNPHSLEIRIRPLNQVEEYHLGEIADVTVRERWLAPADVIVHLEDGEKVKLRHVDQAHQVRSYLLRQN